MSWVEIQHVKKSRKDHRCLGCLETIPKGSELFRFAGEVLDEGNQFGSFVLCKPCAEYYDHSGDYDYPDNYFADGEIGELRKQNPDWRNEKCLRKST